MSSRQTAIRPDYYRAAIRGHTFDVIDLYHAFGLNAMRGAALKYIVRAGQKDVAKEKEDLQKAVECLSREIAWLEELDASD